ncbi:hypothetical protein ACFLTB_04915 [Chloroflexota bacterium]
MVTITNYQKREPQSNSSFPTRDYLQVVCPRNFSVKAIKVKETDINNLIVFFPSQDNAAIGIELKLAAPEAIAFGHAILGVALGNVDEMIGQFQTD